MSAEEPSNAVLAQKIDDLEDRMKARTEDEVRFHSRMEGRMEAFSSMVVALQTSAAVQEAKATAKVEALTVRLDAHDKYHSDTEKGARFRTGVLIATLTAIGTLATAGLAIALALH
jgi:hypothetical protein